MTTPTLDRPLPTSPIARWRSIPGPLQLFLAVAIALNIIAVISLSYYWVHYGEMWRVELFSAPREIFSDFWHYHWLFQFIHTPAFFSHEDRFAYPAPCAVILDVLYHLPYPHGVFCSIYAVTLLLSAYLFARVLSRFGFTRTLAFTFAAITAFTAYPWLKLLDRSNIELFIYIFLATGVWAYVSGRHSLAAVLWGCAGAMKLYPLVMLAVLFPSPKYRTSTLRPLAIGFATFLIVLIGSFWFVGPTIHDAAIGSLKGITGFLGNYAGTSRVTELNIDHSLLGAIKEVCLLDKAHLDKHWAHQSTGYDAAVLLIAPFLYWFRIRSLPLWNQLALFLLAIPLLSPVSYDYTLVHVYLVFAIVTASLLYLRSQGSQLPHATAFFLAFAVIASSQGWIQYDIFRLNGLIKCIALITIAVLLLITPLTLGPTPDNRIAT